MHRYISEYALNAQHTAAGIALGCNDAVDHTDIVIASSRHKSFSKISLIVWVLFACPHHHWYGFRSLPPLLPTRQTTLPPAMPPC